MALRRADDAGGRRVARGREERVLSVSLPVRTVSGVALAAGTLRWLVAALSTALTLSIVVLLVAPGLSVRLTPAVFQALQNRFPPDPVIRGTPVAILVPGGGVNDYVASNGAPTNAGKRVVGAIALAKRFPSARIVLSGSGEVDPTPALAAVGIRPDRVIVEDESHDTYQNAAYAAELLHPRRGQHFILVTTALHMPRAVGAYRKAGFDVDAVPVQFQSLDAFESFGPVWKEVAGLVAYFLLARSTAPFPGP